MTASADGQTLKRRIGLGLLTLYGVGVMVGAGIYVLVGQIAGAIGPWAPLAFLVAALIAAPTAVSYAALSAMIPEAAGEAAYVRRATGSETAASLVGLAVAVTGIVTAAAVLQGGVGYLRAVLDLPAAWLIAAIGAALGAAAVVGVLESLALAGLFTLIEVIGLVVVVGAGMSGPAIHSSVPAVPWAGLGTASLLAFFAFIGFQNMVNMAEETRRPERTVPRAILAALALTTVLYVLVAWAASRAVPAEALGASERPLALVYETATGRGAGFLALIAVFAAMNGVLAQLVMAARVFYGVGRYAGPFRVFHHAHPRFGTPVAATVLATVAVVMLALTLPLVALARATSLVLLAVFGGMNLMLILLRRRGYGIPVRSARPWVPWAGLILSTFALLWGFAS